MFGLRPNTGYVMSALLGLLLLGRLVGVRRCKYSLLPPLPRAWAGSGLEGGTRSATATALAEARGSQGREAAQRGLASPSSSSPLLRLLLLGRLGGVSAVLDTATSPLLPRA